MLAFLEGPEAIVVVVVLLLVFGANRVPKLARQLGQAQRELKKGMHEGFAGEETDPVSPAASPVEATATSSDPVEVDTEVRTASVEPAAALPPPLPPPSP